VPGFALGGIHGFHEAGSAVQSAGHYISKMDGAPFNKLPDFMSGTGEWIKDKFTAFIKDKVSGLLDSAAGAITGGMTGTIQPGRYPGVTGDTDFVPALGNALSKMALATKTAISVQSGRRSLAEQAALYAQYLAGTGNLAAPPNPNAPHVRGIAADITPGRERFGGVAGKYGLGFTVPSESWHIELLKRGGIIGRVIKFLAGGGVIGKGGTGLDLGSKPVLNINELTTLAAKHGMPDPAVMAAIAMAESSGRVGAIGDGGASHGLWQIHTPSWPQFSAAKLHDANYNAKAAKHVRGTQGLTAWSVYNSGDYRKFLGGQVLGGASGGGGGGAGGGGGGGASAGGLLDLAINSQAPDKFPPLPPGEIARLVEIIGRDPGRGKEKLKGFIKHIKGMGLPQSISANLASFTSAADLAADMADRASQLGAAVGGKDEAGWLGDELAARFGLRNTLARAQEMLAGKVEKVKALQDTAKDVLRAVKKAINEADKRRRELERKLKDAQAKLRKELAKPPNQQSGERIQALKHKIRGLADAVGIEMWNVEAGKRRQDAINGSILPELGKKARALGQDRGGILGELVTVQGLGGPLGVLGELPPLGVLGGDIFTLQMRLKELGTKVDVSDGGGGSTDDSALAEALREKLSQMTQRYQISQLQYQALQSTPYLGAFAKGGVALVGERGPELAHLPSGTRIHDAADTESMIRPQVIINGDIINTPRGMDPVEVLINDRRFAAAVEQVGRRQGRGAGRGLPSSGGGR
jgi:hypothetical protein